MAKITEYTLDTNPTGDDLVITVNDPGTAPANRKVRISDLIKGIADSDILNKIKNVDGSGSGLDADLLDGIHVGSLSNGYLPYYNSYENGLLNSPVWTNGTNVSINGTSYVYSKLTVFGSSYALDDHAIATFQTDSRFGLTIGVDETSNYIWIYARKVGVERKRLYLEAEAFSLGTGSFPSGGGTPVLILAQASSNPTGIPSDTAGIFAKDVSGTCELFAFDESGNVTQLSAHPQDLIAQVDDSISLPHFAVSENQYIGKRVGIDLYTLAKEVEKLTGKKIIYEQDIEKRDWNADQAVLVQKRNEEIANAQAKLAQLEAQIEAEKDEEKKQKLIEEKTKVVVPEPYQPKPMPDWLVRRLPKVIK